MLLRITAKANEKVKINELSHIVLNKEPKFFEEWYVNMLSINRKNYFIFTEGFSLFSIIKYAKGINSPDSFEGLFKETIKELFNDLAPDMKDNNMPLIKFEYSKTENGRILKNQSDQIYHAKRYAEEGINTFQINRIPLKAIGFRFPVDVFIEEIQKVMLSKGFIWIPDSIKN